ncbi:ACT domain-containing protein [Gandjariella thermophila]|uniref:Amino acid-binding protein n=1 Tax=Gandjariella thermophila TaxID=1931992 RepID=A0A4D4J7L6_9PSEU|nr:ACT domain-containing protein [Gandjariella thermophila]GDY30499.1 amino acid-binding protein [Gandjariella thermophila]
MKRVEIDLRPGEYAVARLAADAEVPPGLLGASGLVSVTRTPDELSVVCPAEHLGALPAGARTSDGWRLLTVRGPLEFTLTGIMAALSAALAAAGVTLFALSTFDTDHVLVRSADLDRAVRALRDGGHQVHTG